MIIIGLTGGIGSGKSTIAEYIKKKRIPVFDSDVEVRKFYIKKDKDLIKIIKKIDAKKHIIVRGKINKKKLSKIVFNENKKLKMLEGVIFKKLRIKRDFFLKKNKLLNKKIVVLNVPLLFENKINKMCDYVIVTKAPLKTRIKRVLKRQGMNIEKFNKINHIQIPEKKRTILADFVVTTAVKKSTTYKKIDKILNKIEKKNNHIKQP